MPGCANCYRVLKLIILEKRNRARHERGPHADARLRGDARGRDGGVREELAAGGKEQFGGRPMSRWQTIWLSLLAIITVGVFVWVVLGSFNVCTEGTDEIY